MQSLMELVNPHEKTDEEIIYNLKKFYHLLSEAKENDSYIWTRHCDNVSSYTAYIPYLYTALLKKDYKSVCHIIQSVLYFNNEYGKLFQKRDKSALLSLLGKEFCDDTNIEKNIART
ncbi:hypothetical protein FL857_03420 [Criibacterium bergeronii]|uniref:Uncharacterized protein n=1 Tax=Criibacterium bergeronii TaxID=1871336 RepID=A0A552VC47_9FIRM|nr:hypothetical protein [Criibacterium bergeronii]TRW28054.1 hypothetical protein FL857_03420 [Criibacterium bergeronii]